MNVNDTVQNIIAIHGQFEKHSEQMDYGCISTCIVFSHVKVPGSNASATLRVGAGTATKSLK